MSGARFVCFACLLVICCSCSRYHTDPITPVEMTRTAMTETFARIDLYARSNNSVPLSIDVLPKREHYMNRTTDGWGRPLQYSASPDGTVSLGSLGRDGVPGGQGEDADISEAYYTRRPDGTLWVGSGLWLVEGEVRTTNLQPAGGANGRQPFSSETNWPSASDSY